jgi:TatD DNase family protein
VDNAWLRGKCANHPAIGENEEYFFRLVKIYSMKIQNPIESLKYLPMEKIFFETDENNDNVEQMYRQGAMLKKMPVEEIKKATWDNFNRIENELISRF